MKVLCFGSANLDHVYKVNHFTVPGETQGCLEYTVKCGGKGVNQAIAMSLAGNETYFAGIIGNDGTLLKDALVGKNVNIDYLKISNKPPAAAAPAGGGGVDRPPGARGAAGPSDPHRAKPAAGGVHRPPV